jgi:predicted nucleic acid-binding protein
VAADSRPRVYLDADVYLHVIADQEHADVCQSVLDAAGRGDIQLIASRLISVEVGGWKGGRTSPQAADELLAKYLDGVSAEWVEVDVMVARDAQGLSWKYNLRAGDAIHLATAIRRRADYFMSYDKAFPFDQTVTGVSVMRPGAVWQPLLFDQ